MATLEDHIMREYSALVFGHLSINIYI